MTTVCVAWAASGTGMQSFAFPLAGRIVQVQGAVPSSATAISVNQLTAPGAGTFNGGDKGLICILNTSGASAIPVVDNIDFPIDVGQTVFIDVKTAGVFSFYVRS